MAKIPYRQEYDIVTNYFGYYHIPLANFQLVRGEYDIKKMKTKKVIKDLTTPIAISCEYLLIVKLCIFNELT